MRLLFQKILLVQNPEPYLEQRKGNHTAVEMRNATLSWTKAASGPDLPNGQVKNHKQDETDLSESLATLKNISFTLPKVCSESSELVVDPVEGQLKGFVFAS